MVYPRVRERMRRWLVQGCSARFGKWCQAASAVVVQRVLGEEEGVGVIAECCDSRLHSLHRAVGVAVCGLGDEERVHFLVYPRVRRA